MRGDWSAGLARLAAAHDVPGAAVMMRVGGAVHRAAVGICSSETGEPVGLDTTFRLGSMSKLYTSALLVEVLDVAGISVDAPVLSILTALPTGARERLAGVTIADLLSHASGLFGDLLTDFGSRDDRFALYTERAADLERTAAPGAVFSYCNAGFVLAARITECVAGRPWAELVAERIIIPFRLTCPGGFAPGDAAATAIGHEVAAPGAWSPVVDDGPNFTMTPAGATAWSNTDDILSFVDDALLRATSAQRMSALRTPCPVATLADGFGLGIARFHGGQVNGHDGAVPGQLSFLRFVPETGDVLIVLTNGGDGRSLFHDLVADIAKAIGVRFDAPPPLWPERRSPPSPSDYLGRFASRDYAVDLTIDQTGGPDPGLTATFAPLGHVRDLKRAVKVPFAHISDDRFLARFPHSRLPTDQIFHRDGSGQVRALTFRGRYFPKVTAFDDRHKHLEVQYG